MPVNKADLSGVITEIAKDCILFKQIVCGVMETTFCLHLQPAIRDAVSALNLSIGEEILILSAQAYAKNGQFKFRIESTDQIIRLHDATGETLYQGEEDAEQFL